MARPRKDSGIEDARQRLIASFWELLECYDLKDITVSMVAAHAGCNRGTFYYHFSDIGELVYCAIEQDLLTECSTAETVFAIASGNAQLIDPCKLAQQFSHLCLVMDKGGMKTIDDYVKPIIIGMWEAILCHEGEHLTPEAEVLVHYSASGVLGVMAYLHANRTSMTPANVLQLFQSPFFTEMSALILAQLSIAQNVTPAQIVERVRTLMGNGSVIEHIITEETC